MYLAENLLTLRKRKGITQEQLAEALHVSRQAVSKWESGAGYPELETLARICDYFAVSMDDMIRTDISGGIPDPEIEANTAVQLTDGAERNDRYAQDDPPRKKAHTRKPRGWAVRVNGKEVKGLAAVGVICAAVVLVLGVVLVLALAVNVLLLLLLPVLLIALFAVLFQRRSWFGVLPLTGICLYLILGAVFDQWHPWWVLVPLGALGTAILEIISKPRKWPNALPVIGVCAYLALGAFFNQWHPWWVLIPAGGLLCAIFTTLQRGNE